MIIGLCRTFPALDPEAARRADAQLLRMADVFRLAHPPEGGEQGP